MPRANLESSSSSVKSPRHEFKALVDALSPRLSNLLPRLDSACTRHAELPAQEAEYLEHKLNRLLTRRQGGRAPFPVASRRSGLNRGRPRRPAADVRSRSAGAGVELQVGIHSIVARRFELVVEAGFGQRTHGLVNLGYRF